MFLRSILVLTLAISFISAKAYSIEFPPPKYTTTYHTVKKGETLGVLAGYYMLNPREWRKIREWNPSQIRGSRIYPGQELLIFINKKWTPPFNLDAYVNKWYLGLNPDGTPVAVDEEIEVIEGSNN